MSSGAAKAVLRAIRCASELRINGGSAVDAAMPASSSFTPHLTRRARCDGHIHGMTRPQHVWWVLLRYHRSEGKGG